LHNEIKIFNFGYITLYHDPLTNSVALNTESRDNNELVQILTLRRYLKGYPNIQNNKQLS